MRTCRIVGGLIGLALAAAPAMAGVVFQVRMPIPEMVAAADVIVLGKVTGIQKNFVAVLPEPKARKKEFYQIVELRVEEALHGGKELSSIKMGVPCGEITTPRGKQIIPGLTWNMGQEACLFLKKHPTGDFYVTGLGEHFSKQLIPNVANNNYQKDLDLTRRCVKLLGQEDLGLKSDDALDRYLAAAMWIRKYRGPEVFNFGAKPQPKPKAKEEPIDAEQSKRILKALAEADWSTAAAHAAVAPADLFRRRGLTAKDGWTFQQRAVNPLDQRAKARADAELARAARRWLRENAETYRIRRIVDASAAKKGEPKGSE
jgi:hypothetical protein